VGLLSSVGPGRRRFLRNLSATALGVTASGAAVPAAAASVAPGDTTVPDLTGDAAGALNQAIEAASSRGGGVVLVAAGTHQLDADVRMRSHVTLRGITMTGSRLVGASVVHEAGTEGATVEDLTIEEGPHGLRYQAVQPDELGASYCIARRLRLLRAGGTAIDFDGGSYHHIYLDDLSIEDAGADGIALRAQAPCQSIFFTKITVERFGAARERSHAVRLGARCQISQIHLTPVRVGEVGIGFEAGSDHTTVTNLAIETEGGIGLRGQVDRVGVMVGAHQVRVL